MLKSTPEPTLKPATFRPATFKLANQLVDDDINDATDRDGENIVHIPNVVFVPPQIL